MPRPRHRGAHRSRTRWSKRCVGRRAASRSASALFCLLRARLIFRSYVDASLHRSRPGREVEGWGYGRLACGQA